MISQEKNQFKNNLLIILDELNNYKRDKSYLLTRYVEDRLNSSLLVYYKEISSSFNYLRTKDNLKIARHL